MTDSGILKPDGTPVSTEEVDTARAESADYWVLTPDGPMQWKELWKKAGFPLRGNKRIPNDTTYDGGYMNKPIPHCSFCKEEMSVELEYQRAPGPKTIAAYCADCQIFYTIYPGAKEPFIPTRK